MVIVKSYEIGFSNFQESEIRKKEILTGNIRGNIMEHLLQVMIETARESGRIMRMAAMEEIAVKTKSSFRDLVTKYDLQVQEYAVSALSKAFPEARFISEEDDANQSQENGLVFVIDPIDGTANFSHHYQHSCTSIACVIDGRPVAGAVYNPFLDEMFTALEGRGAFLNGAQMKIPAHTLKESLVLFGSSPYNLELAEETFRNVQKIFGKCQDIRRSGSAALDLCYVAAGRAGLYFESRLSLWDYAAGVLIVREAGGICRTLEGEELVFHRPTKCSIIAGTESVIAESGL